MDGDRMYTMLLAHLVAALVGPVLVRAMGRNAFFLLALAPGASTVWLATLDPGALAETPLEVSDSGPGGRKSKRVDRRSAANSGGPGRGPRAGCRPAVPDDAGAPARTPVARTSRSRYCDGA